MLSAVLCKMGCYGLMRVTGVVPLGVLSIGAIFAGLLFHGPFIDAHER